MSDVGVIILAAGASTRLGTPKQLLQYHGRSLIQHSVHVALASVCRPVLVVLGAYAERIQPQLASLDVQIVQNPDWQQGMSRSLQVGLSYLIETAEIQSNDLFSITASVLLVCDQPLVSSARLNQLVEQYRSTKSSIVASEYNQILGVPALFDRALFSELMALQGDAGARAVIRRYAGQAARIACPEAEFDIDTIADYDRLMRAAGKIG